MMVMRNPEMCTNILLTANLQEINCLPNFAKQETSFSMSITVNFYTLKVVSLECCPFLYAVRKFGFLCENFQYK